jgi:hypothetical protein
MAVTLYRQVGKGKARRYNRVNLGPGRRPSHLAGPYFLRYSLPDGTRPWNPVGGDLDAAIEALKRKEAYFEALRSNVPVLQDQEDSNRRKIADTIYQWMSELQILRGKDQQAPTSRFLVITTAKSTGAKADEGIRNWHAGGFRGGGRRGPRGNAKREQRTRGALFCRLVPFPRVQTLADRNLEQGSEKPGLDPAGSLDRGVAAAG